MFDGKPGFYIPIGEAWLGCEGDSGLDHAEGWGGLSEFAI